MDETTENRVVLEGVLRLHDHFPQLDGLPRADGVPVGLAWMIETRLFQIATPGQRVRITIEVIEEAPDGTTTEE